MLAGARGYTPNMSPAHPFRAPSNSMSGNSSWRQGGGGGTSSSTPRLFTEATMETGRSLACLQPLSLLHRVSPSQVLPASVLLPRQSTLCFIHKTFGWRWSMTALETSLLHRQLRHLLIRRFTALMRRPWRSMLRRARRQASWNRGKTCSAMTIMRRPVACPS